MSYDRKIECFCKRTEMSCEISILYVNFAVAPPSGPLDGPLLSKELPTSDKIGWQHFLLNIDLGSNTASKRITVTNYYIAILWLTKSI